MKKTEPDEYLTEKETAAVLKVSPRTIQDWRLKKIGPDYLRLNRSVRYRRGDVDKYAARGEVRAS